MKMKSFWSYYLNTIIRPSRTFNLLTEDKNGLKYGLFGLLFPAIGYTLFYIMASNAGGAPTTFKPWLAIPADKYFFYDIFLALPGYFFSIFVTTSTIYLLSKAMKGTATYDKLFAVIGISIGIASWSTMLHDLTDSFLAFVGIIDMKAYEKALNEPTFWRNLLLTLFLIYFTWFLILFTKGIKAASKLSNFKSAVLGFIALVLYQGTLLIFIR